MFIAAMPGLPLLIAQASAVPPGSPPADIRDIVPAQPYFLPANYLWLVIGLGSLLLAGWILWSYFLRGRTVRPARGPTPRAVAARRLQELEAQIDALGPREFGAEVCAVLRTYIGAQFGLHPERQTSPEFLAAIADASVFSDGEKMLLAEFLDQCDLLKFARQDATRDGKLRLLKQAAEFLETTCAPKSPLQPAAAAAPV